jgi:hypothetical protein
MTLTTQSFVEFLIGILGIISATAGFSAWATSTQIKHDITTTISNLKQDSVTLRRRVRLLEQFAVKGGFQTEATIREDTDL